MTTRRAQAVRDRRQATPSAERIRSRDGAPLLVRPIEPSDRAALGRHFDHLGEESRYRRFLAPIRHLTEKDLTYFTDVDHRQHEALIALAKNGEIVGVARYICLPNSPEVAEVAVAVTDDWQGRGVGTGLLQRLAQRARAAGVRSFLGICLIDNRDMRRLLNELGPNSRTRLRGDGTVEVEVELPDRAGRRHVAPPLRAAARGFHRHRGPRTRGPSRVRA